MRIPTRLLPHTVIIRPHLGAGAYGDVYGEPQTVKRANVESTRRLVRNTEGHEVVSSTTVYMEPREVPDGSMITIHPDTPFEAESKVIAVGLLQHPRGLSHLTIHLE